MGSRLDEQVSIRLSESDMKRLEALAARISNMKRLAIARAALLIGLAEIEADPTKLVDAGPASPPSAETLSRSSRSRRGRK